MTTREIADALGLTTAQVRKLIYNGTLDAEKIGNRWSVDQDSYDDYYDSLDMPSGDTEAGEPAALDAAAPVDVGVSLTEITPEVDRSEFVEIPVPVPDVTVQELPVRVARGPMGTGQSAVVPIDGILGDERELTDIAVPPVELEQMSGRRLRGVQTPFDLASERIEASPFPEAQAFLEASVGNIDLVDELGEVYPSSAVDALNVLRERYVAPTQKIEVMTDKPPAEDTGKRPAGKQTIEDSREFGKGQGATVDLAQISGIVPADEVRYLSVTKPTKKLVDSPEITVMEPARKAVAAAGVKIIADRDKLPGRSSTTPVEVFKTQTGQPELGKPKKPAPEPVYGTPEWESTVGWTPERTTYGVEEWEARTFSNRDFGPNAGVPLPSQPEIPQAGTTGAARARVIDRYSGAAEAGLAERQRRLDEIRRKNPPGTPYRKKLERDLYKYPGLR